MGYVYFSVNEEKIIDSILSIAQDVYGIKGVKSGVIIPMHSEKCRILLVVVNYILMTMHICVKK